MRFSLPFKNVSSESIPPFAIVRAEGYELVGIRPILTVGKPDTYGSQYTHYINGPTEVAAGKCGGCSNEFPCVARIETGTPVVGELWGARDDKWGMNAETDGFEVLGLTSNNLVIVQRSPMLAFTGFFTTAVAKGATGTVEVYFNGSTTGQTVTGVVAVQNTFSTLDAVNVSWVNKNWEAYFREDE